MRDETNAAWSFWTKWIWIEAWEPSMKFLNGTSLVTRATCFACLLGLSGFFAFEGYEKTADQAKWFLWNNIVGATILFLPILGWNLFLAPGRLLMKEVGRELTREWLIKINERIGEAGRLMEEIRLGLEMSIAQRKFEKWREETRGFFKDNLPLWEPIFDDIEMGPFGPLLELPARLRAIGPPGFTSFIESQPEDPRTVLVDMISRRRANLQRIYEKLVPMSISGDYRHV